MSKFTYALTLALILPFAQAAMAQNTTTKTPPAKPADSAAAAKPAADAGAKTDGKAADDASTDKKADNGLAMGQDVDGKVYVKDTQGDWTVRCYHTKDNKDPCEMFQILKDDKGNSVAEYSLVPLPAGGQAVAGATITTPLETLLTQDVTIGIDGSGAKRYPFLLCNPTGCFARIGLTQQDLDSYKKGTKGTMTIFAAQQPQSPIALNISLKGFTAAFEEVAKSNAANDINPMGAAPKK